MKKVAILDIETTGLNALKHSIVEIGIVELNLDTCKTKVLFDSLVKEALFGEQDRNAWIFKYSDMKFEDVNNAPLLSGFIQELQEIFKKYKTTAFNKSFDFGFLKARGIEFHDELPCIMQTATNILKIPSSCGDYKYPKVQEAWDHYYPDKTYIEKHRALDDAVHEALILLKMYQHGQFSF